MYTGLVEVGELVALCIALSPDNLSQHENTMPSISEALTHRSPAAESA